jgi:hypothetical protein
MNDKLLWIVEAVKDGWLPSNQVKFFFTMEDAYAFSDRVCTEGGKTKVKEYMLLNENVYPRESGINSW